MTKEDKEKCIDDSIASLRLSRCQNTKIGVGMNVTGISAGERKRLNIASEILPDPDVLLCEECTSSLDSSSALTVVLLIQEFSAKGKTVICSINQPSQQMFNQLARILLLCSRRVAYFGAPSVVQEYFSRIGYPFPSTSHNPSDRMLELIIEDITSVEVDETDPEANKALPQLSTIRILAAWKQHGSQPYTRSEQKSRTDPKLSILTMQPAKDLMPETENERITINQPSTKDQ